ncbi:MAG: phosphoenolpyruvate mutase [Myxococcota bacterium]
MTSSEVTILMEAHNGLSAKLAEEAGFEALWASGLAISSALGVRDNNEASWTQVLEVLEFMSDATSIPILLDGDTGYGNFNNVTRLVRKLEERGIAGVCLEDKLFPKTNSFLDGDKQALAGVDEFCGKLRAAKDCQRNPDFVVVARTEAFIAGWGLSEALLRATAYARNGADLILVHSKRSDSAEIMSFMDEWERNAIPRPPIIIVPTKYPSEPIASFTEKRIHNFIFANQGMRTVITALQTNLRKLRESGDLMSIENEIAPVDEIFRLQNVGELKRAEDRYLPTPVANVRAVVLAATQGDFGELVEEKPKAMLYLKGKPILSWHVEAFRRQQIREIGVVRGFRKESVDLDGLHYFDNDDWSRTGELASLYAARDFLRGDLVIAYGDVVFDDFILKNLLAYDGGIKIAVDASWRLRCDVEPDAAPRDMVSTAGAASPLGDGSCTLTAIGRDLPPNEVTGAWIGLLMLRADGTAKMVELLDEMKQREPESFETADLPQLIRTLMDAGEQVNVVHSYGHWRDINEQKDLIAAEAAR